MKTKKLGYLLLGIGIFLIIFGFASDWVGLGKKGIQSAQLLIIQAGIAVSAISAGFIGLKEEDFRFSVTANRLISRLVEAPTSTWILIGFFIVFVLLFVFPMFFNNDRAIDYFTGYVPDIRPIGRDLSFNTSSIRNWLDGKGLYDYENHYYPPLYAVVFSPFLLLEYPYTYFVMTTITLACAIISGLVIPSLLMKDKDRTLPLFFFITVIFSYGMQFELERGQFNILAFTFSLLAIYIFHRYFAFRHFAYLLISISAQIKLYPAIFMALFIKDWRDWKGNLLRFAGLGAFNIALLFVLGIRVFQDFLNAVPTLIGAVWIRPYNHSLTAFVNELTTTGLGILQPETVSNLSGQAAILKLTLLLIYIACFVVVITRSYINDDHGINFDLLLVCTIGALIIPSVSIDYKLPLLSPALALALTYAPRSMGGVRRVFRAFLLISVSLAYSLTLFSFIYRPVWLGNSFPLFMTILIAVTLLNVIDRHTYPSLDEWKHDSQQG